MTVRSMRATAGLVMMLTAAGGLSACGAAEKRIDEAKASASAQATSRAAASSTSAPRSTRTAAPSSSSTSGGTPIGSDDITMGSGSATSYPPEEMSGMWATDCQLGATRIYDRSGITCAKAQSTVSAYEASGANGGNKTIGDLTCSHNPSIMVEQGAAPGKCLDAGNNEVLGWRYPGAPQPAH